MISKLRLIALICLVAFLAFFWESPYMLFLKVFVVYLHELSHALGALLTGGHVLEMAVEWDESGFTKTQGGNFLVIASSGYLGSILWGFAMLNASFAGKFYRALSIAIGFLFIAAAFFFLPNALVSFYYFSLVWGFALLLLPIFFPRLTRVVLFFLGGLTSLYALYDLGDFFRGDILQTDAGIIASHYLYNQKAAFWGGYAIGISITFVSLWLVYSLTLQALHKQEEFIEEGEDFDAEEWQEDLEDDGKP